MMTLATLSLRAFAVLVVIWLASLLTFPFRRRRVARLQTLASALKRDHHDAEHSHRLIDDAFGPFPERSVAFVFPILIPVTLLTLAIIGLAQRLRGLSPFSPLEGIEWARFRDQEAQLADETARGLSIIRADPRFRRLVELAFEVEMLRSPALSLITVILSAPPLLLYALAYGGREALLILPQIALHLACAFRPLFRQPTGLLTTGATEPARR